jgi:hypothetical protein
LVLLPRIGLDDFLFVTGYEFETPIPMIDGPVRGGERIPEAAKPFPPTARWL